ncbi:MAG TPA: AAA family ATPase [Telluria sp.]
MRILKISGRNLASLAGEFCVDFEQEPLKTAGLFAISGPTGAGKSTLLDAMCLALYDATPRLLKRKSASLLPDVGDDTVSVHDPRTLLRRGATDAWAEVDFVGNDALRYRARWSVKRSRNKVSGPLQKSSMSLHQLPELAALGKTNTEVLAEISQRVGLSFEQFTRAVLLAQNEFSAFLKTEENERGELLETLTGSAIYSAISRRAFERFKAEQTASQRLAMQLAGQTPLAPDARTELDTQAAMAETVLLQVDEKKALLEQRLRWQQESDKLDEQAASAEAAIAASRAAVGAAGERRRHLATIDAVQPARALVGERTRLAAERANVESSIAACNDALAAAAAAQEQAAKAATEAGGRVHAAEQAQRVAAPLLDAAKALDATIAALTPSHAGAAQALAAATRDADAARAAASEAAAKLDTDRSAHKELASWLDAHRTLEALASQWPRWDKLFAQAAQEAARERALASELALAQAAADAARVEEQGAAAALAEAGTRLQALETARQQSIQALTAFDTRALHTARQSLEQRRDSLATAEKAWSELDAGRTRLQHAVARAGELAQATTAAEAQLAQAVAAAGAIDAARAQSERSHDAAQLACAGSVEELRATLEDDAPCPVCGSADHPYQHQDASLRAMLASLHAEVIRCRAVASENVAAQSAQRAVIAANARQMAVLRREQEALEAGLATAQATWSANPLAAEAGQAEWFAAQMELTRARSRELDAQEQAQRSAAGARDKAQAACDLGTAERDRLQAAAASAHTKAAQASASLASLAERRANAAASLAGFLDDLDAAFGASQWRAAWAGDPDGFRAQRADAAAQWNTHSARHATLSATLATQQVAHAALQKREEHAVTLAAAAKAAFERLDLELAARQHDRKALWDGRAVRDVETELMAAIDTARNQLAAHQVAREHAAHAETRARESLAHNKERLAAIEGETAAAAARLDAWLAGFSGQHPGLDAVDGATLDRLLVLEPAWIAQERAALAALDTAAANAATVLAERHSRRELHLQSAPAGAPQPAAALTEALEALQAERKLAHDAATALRLQVAQDNVRRENAESVMAEIEAQQLVERRWGQMNELIGSADGKKFRNYAQQFTLDVLLGYANSHLAHLARRYRLERVLAASGPSLGLLVRDQDMGGEIRSVNSLSGGESFLVSLALALGLASLSSNRVRVESLFIDEGFGSLDSDTLRVAMDALDGLHSTGRKVGVISHVQEMTERISTKILVQPSGGGTSSVTVQ